MKKILIVDDLVEIRELVNVTLRGDDYQILEVKTGKEAIDITEAENPDLIIMDIMMPGGMGGLEATRVLKNDPETKDCRIIMLTAKGQKEDIAEGFKAGVDDYFVKPFSPLTLINKVEEFLK